MNIKKNYQDIRNEIPDNVTIIGATKTRDINEIKKAVNAGMRNIGENYVQEAQKKYNELGKNAQKLNWHMIGHLQKNKINKALPIFDMVQTVESEYRAKHINKRAGRKQMIQERERKKVPVLIEVNIGKEESKYGVEPEYLQIKELSESIESMNHLKLKGLMTMEPYSEDPEDSRSYFKEMKRFYDKLKEESINMEILSMGMTNSYNVAVEEGSNMVRIGREIFGERE